MGPEDVQSVFEQMLADDFQGDPEYNPEACAEKAKMQTVHFYEAWQAVQRQREESDG